MNKKKDIYYWLKLYHKFTYEFYNVYNSQAELVAFVTPEEGQIFKKYILQGKYHENISKAKNKTMANLFNQKHVFIDPKDPSTLKDKYAEHFSIIMAKHIYSSLGHNNLIYKSNEKVYKNLIEFFRSKSKYILNIGSGQFDSVFFSRKCKFYVSLDLCSFPQKNSNSENIVGDVYYLPFKEQCFDIILSIFLLEHLCNIGNIISQIKKLLKKDGMFVFTIPLVYITKNEYFYSIEPVFYHFYFFTLNTYSLFDWITPLSDLERLISAHGLTKVKTKIYHKNGQIFKKKDCIEEGIYELYAISCFIKK